MDFKQKALELIKADASNDGATKETVMAKAANIDGFNEFDFDQAWNEFEDSLPTAPPETRSGPGPTGDHKTHEESNPWDDVIPVSIKRKEDGALGTGRKYIVKGEDENEKEVVNLVRVECQDVKRSVTLDSFNEKYDWV